MAIECFAAEFRFLSNFYPCLIQFEGQIYDSVEHAYQAAKTLDPKLRSAIKLSGRASKAKEMGQTINLRKDWDAVKLTIMEELVRYKFKQMPHLKQKLMDTKSEKLIEGNNWGDVFWGVCDGKGKNHLGKILMKIRDELK